MCLALRMKGPDEFQIRDLKNALNDVYWGGCESCGSAPLSGHLQSKDLEQLSYVISDSRTKSKQQTPVGERRIDGSVHVRG